MRATVDPDDGVELFTTLSDGLGVTVGDGVGDGVGLGFVTVTVSAHLLNWALLFASPL